MRKISLFLTVILLMASISLLASDRKTPTDKFSETSGITQVPSSGAAIEAAGDTLYTFPVQGNGTGSNLCVGLGVYNDTVIVSSAGLSSTATADNMFYRYTLDGTFIDSVAQPNPTAGWGYRDLAFDGTNILGSDNNNIKMFDPVTMAEVGFITNASNSPHRGIAYDPVENAIYTTNFTSGPLVKIDAATGTTLRNYGNPSVAPYGIAWDPYSSVGEASLWYAEPSLSGTFRLSKVDTATGAVVFTFDLTAMLPLASSGGLEIINNHPSYPGKIIAVMLVQGDPIDFVAFVDITVAGTPKAPTDVTATIVTTDADVDVTWVDPTEDLAGAPLTVDSVVVYRNGARLGAVAAGVQAWADTDVPAGVSVYSVIAWFNDSPSAEAFSNAVASGAALYEDFSAGAGAWTITNDGGTCVWDIHDASEYTLPAEAAGNVLAADADACGSGSTLLSTATLTTPFSTTGYMTVMLEFDSDWQAIDADDSAFVEISNDGATWVRYLTYDVVDVRNVHVSLDISATAADQATVWMRFVSIQPGWDWWWAIDNIGVYPSNYVPVELESFSANVVGDKVLLNWSTATETNNSGFSVERSDNDADFSAISFVDGNGTTSEKSSYQFVDNSVSSGTYYYRLKQTDYDGTFAYSNTVEVDLGLPKVFALEQNFPNPFNPSTTISFSIPVESKVSIKLFNTLGQEVAQIVNNEFAAGNQKVEFDASVLSSGVYFYTIEATGTDGAKYVNTKKMMLMK